MTDNTTLLSFGERLQAIRESLNLKRPEFSKLIGVSLDTVQRVENRERDKTNDYVFSQTVRALPVVEPFLSAATDELPANLVQYISTKKAANDKDGDKLRAFMKHRSITQRELAQKLALTQPQINHYLKSQNLRPDIKIEIAKAMNVSETAIWPKQSTVFKLADLIALPIISANERSKLDRENLSQLVECFDAKAETSRTYYLHKGDMTPSDVANAFVAEVSRYDNMQPLLPAGSLVVGVLLDPDQYDSVLGNFVLISVGSAVVIRRIASNSLRTTDVLQLASLEGYGGTLNVKRSDILFMAILKKAIIDL